MSDVPTPKLQIPTNCMNYEIVRKIGAGLQGTIYLVKSKNSELLALKSFFMNELESTNETLHEYSLLKELDHPNICQYLDLYLDMNEYTGATTVNITMPYCSLGDLAAFLKNAKSPLMESDVMDIALQIARAVQYLHKCGIVHRDLKPSNIFLTMENGKICAKLGDFGLSSKSKETSLKETICGSVPYVAPEVMNQSKYNGFDADRFSLGALYYNLLTGLEKNLYIKFLTNEEEAVSEIMDDLSKSCSAYLSDAVLRLLKLNPKQRLNMDKLVSLLENPIQDYVNVSNIAIMFGDENFIFDKRGDLPTVVYEFKTSKLVNYLFSNRHVLYVSKSVHLQEIGSRDDFNIWTPSIYNDRIQSPLIAWNDKFVFSVSSVFIKMFRIKTGESTRVLAGHKGSVTCLDADNHHVVSYGGDRKLRLFDIFLGGGDDSKIIPVVLTIQETITFIKLRDKDLFITISPSSTIVMMDLFGKVKFIFKGHKQNVTSIVFWRDFMISGSNDGTIRQWSCTNGFCHTVFSGHINEVNCLMIKDDFLLSGSNDSTIRYWNLKNGKCIGSFKWKSPIIRFPSKIDTNRTEQRQNQTDSPCIGSIRCGHCMKLILVCPHGNIETGVPFCSIDIDTMTKDEFCQESGYFAKIKH